MNEREKKLEEKFGEWGHFLKKEWGKRGKIE